MRKFILWFAIVLLLAGCAASASEGVQMANYQKYLSTATSDYFGAYENSGHVDGLNYGYVGNNSGLTGYYFAFRLPSDFPAQGADLNGYTVDYREVTNATLRLAEVNKGTRGGGTLNLKISPITGEWDPDAAWDTLPAYKADVIDTYSSFGAIPGANNYDTRYGYHAAKYKYECDGASGGGTAYIVGSYYYSNENQGETYSILVDGKEYYFSYVSTIPAYYDYYYKYHEVDITNSVKDAIQNGATGLLLYFDVSDGTYNRKVFTTVLETADSRRPAVSITFGEGSGALSLKQTGLDGQWHQLAGIKQIGMDGQWHELDGLKILTADGWKQIY